MIIFYLQLCDNDLELVSNVESCRRAILENLNITFAKVAPQDHPHPLHPLHPNVGGAPGGSPATAAQRHQQQQRCSQQQQRSTQQQQHRSSHHQQQSSSQQQHSSSHHQQQRSSQQQQYMLKGPGNHQINHINPKSRLQREIFHPPSIQNLQSGSIQDGRRRLKESKYNEDTFQNPSQRFPSQHLTVSNVRCHQRDRSRWKKNSFRNLLEERAEVLSNFPASAYISPDMLPPVSIILRRYLCMRSL